MLVSVLDDTGTHIGSKYSSCIGIVAARKDLHQFTLDWRRQLHRYGVNDFHAKRFYARDHEGKRVDAFRGWSDEKAHEFISELMSLFGSMRSRVVGAAIDTAAFKALPEKERAFFTGRLIDTETGKSRGTGAPSKPFLLAFGIALHRSLEYGRKKIPLSIVLDQSDEFAAQAAIASYEFGKLPKYRGLILGFHAPPRQEFCPLYLADLIAYLWNRYLTTGALTAEQEFAMDLISRKGNTIMRVNGETLDTLREIAKDVLSLS